MKRQKDHEEDVPFDVEPAATSVDATPTAAPKDLLSASKVEAVRFHPAKPGYAYDQVETFVDAVTRTLRYLEHRMYEDDLAIHDAQEENNLLNEQISTLKATIEVFRANGDPVATADGGFATASSVEDPALRAERDSLAAALAASQAEVLDLRTYIDEQLAPWIAEQSEESAEDEPAVAEPATVEESLPSETFEHVTNEDSQVAQESEPSKETATIEDEEVTPAETDEKAVFAATAAAFAAEAKQEAKQVADDWADADLDGWDIDDETEAETVATTEEDQPETETVNAQGLQFSTPEIEATGAKIDPSKIIRTDDSQYERISPPKAGTPLPRLLPPEIAAMMESEEDFN